MKKITFVFGLLLSFLWLSVSMVAQGINDEKSKIMKISSEKLVTVDQPVPIGEFALKSLPPTMLTRRLEASAKAGTLTMDDLLGDYIMTYASLTTSIGSGGGGVTISKISADSILIRNFWQTNAMVKAKVDFATMTIKMASQVVAKSTSYGYCSLCATNQDGTPDRNASIVGTISSTGKISWNTWWGVYVDSGDQADKFLGAYYNTELERTNGKMTAVDTDKKAVEYGVVLAQKGMNVLSVKNFANHGKTIEIILNDDSTFTIASQLAWEGGSTYGDFYTYTFNPADSTRSTAPIAGKGAKKALSFGGWIIVSSVGYHNGFMVSGRIESTFDIQYPSLNVSEFEGKGTESEPYLIKQLDDLRLLAKKVNTDTELIYGAQTKHTKSFLGKYFRMESDIDASSIRLEPIGNVWAQRFSGHFDGNGKKISGMDISVEGSGYAGLFGYVDTLGVVKNITLENPVVKGAGYYVGALVGRSLGLLENCHVVNGTVQNSGVGTGGLAGDAKGIKTASFSGNVLGLAGIVGGIAGQVNGAISDASVTANVIVGGVAATYTGGGVVGTLYTIAASATNCYFMGLVDGSRYTEDLYIGGVIGQSYGGTVNRCFNVGTVKGYGTKSAVGGVIGKASGKITNCYNSGVVYSPGSRQAGGIIGLLVDTYNGVTGELLFHTPVSNCYTCGPLRAETYQYKPESETRETIGTIFEGDQPVIENIYFDKQMLDLTSEKYGVLTNELTSAAGPAGFSSADWVFTEGYYPRLKGMENTDAAYLGASTLKMDTEIPDNVYKVTTDITLKLMGATKAYFYRDGYLKADGHCGVIKDGVIQLKEGTVGNDTIYLVMGDVSKGYNKYYTMTVTPSGTFEGKGNLENPFLIKAKKDLINLAFLTGPQVKQYYKNTYFKMTNDIDMEYDPAFIGICTDAADAHAQFAGYFDGGGYAIHRLKMTDGVAWKVAPEDDPEGLGTPNTNECRNYQGFIGRLSPEGTLCNLTIAADCEFVFWGYSAPLVGYSYGLIENCKNYADVTSHSANAGGISGQIQKGAVIRGCYNAGNISTGFFGAGGIAASSYGTIENCQNDGSITALRLSRFMDLDERFKEKTVGGIIGAGSGCIIRNVVNTGMISGYTAAGGIVGSYGVSSSGDGKNDLSNSVNYGMVFADYVATRGGICGDASTQGTLADNYYDNQLLPYDAAGNVKKEGLKGVGTTVLTSGTVLPNFSADLWSFAEGRYPVLKAFVSEKAAMRASKVLVKVAPKETTGDLLSTITLEAPEGITWSLRRANAFTLSGTTVTVPEMVTAFTRDTLIASSVDGFNKYIPLLKLPPVPLNGKGTATEPYLINTAGDWNAIAGYMLGASKDLKGNYLQVTADLDFKNTEFVPMAGDGILSFEGTLNGNKKSVTNIAFDDADGMGYLGLFGIIGADATVSDLTIGSGSFTSGASYMGAFAGTLAGTLQRCVNKASVTAKSYAAGMAADVLSSARLIDCVNYGAISTPSTGGYIAGIAAKSAAGAEYTGCGNEGTLSTKGSTVGGLVATAVAPVTFTDCYNKGEIEAGGATVAGLVANVSGTDVLAFTGCYNTVDITATSFAAGIVAALNANCQLKASNCYNLGNVMTNASKTGTGTAGIAAYLTAGSTIIDCYNEGNIMSDKATYVGGITGNCATAKEDMPISIRKCHNTGLVIASANYGGGIVGYMTNYMTIDSCYNIGNVEGAANIGGITANMGGAYAVLSNSWNAGDVTGSKYAIGGLVGTNTAAATISNCFNTGTISSTGADDKTAYSVGGLGGQSNATFTNCYNLGNVSAKKNVGGLVGYPYSGAKSSSTGVVTYGTSFINCYNAGDVSKLDTLAGNFVGDTTIKRWNYNRAENLYTLGESGTFETDTIGNVITISELAKLDLGEDWSSGDNYSYPILKACDSDVAKLGAAAVILADGDTFDNVSTAFHVGTPDKVVWTSSSDVLNINGNEVTIKENVQDVVTLTAKIGELNKAITLKLNVNGVGIEDVTDGKILVKEDFYTVSGIQIAETQLVEGNVYVVVRTYDDGTSETVKEMR